MKREAIVDDCDFTWTGGNVRGTAGVSRVPMNLVGSLVS